ncbi:MAG: hypothetical protein AB7H86_09955 [Blastocatellales bacterium]|mgnify:CR=1 FL=1
MKPRWILKSIFLLATVGLLPAVASAQIQFDRPKTEQPLDNPYTMGVAREQIIETAKEVLKKCNIALDESKSRMTEGRLITTPVVYTRGVTTRNDLEYLAVMPASDVRNWTQGRFWLEISALPLDQKRSQLFVAAHIQGRLPDPVTGNTWIDGQSNGRLEDEVIRGLASKLLGIDLSIKKTGNPKRILNCEY